MSGVSPHALFNFTPEMHTPVLIENTPKSKIVFLGQESSRGSKHSAIEQPFPRGETPEINAEELKAAIDNSFEIPNDKKKKDFSVI